MTMLLTVEKIQNFLIGHFGVQSVSDLKNVDIDGDYTVHVDDYVFQITIKDKMLFMEKMTPESKLLFDERKKHGESIEKRARQLSPSEENYCWHEDVRKVYFGGDWEEEDESQFFTEKELTTDFDKTKKLIREKLIESRKDVKVYSFNDIIKIFTKSKKDGTDFAKLIEKNFKKKFK